MILNMASLHLIFHETLIFKFFRILGMPIKTIVNPYRKQVLPYKMYISDTQIF